MISDGQATHNLNLYPPKPNVDVYNPWWDEFEPELDLSLPLLTLGKAHYFKNETKDDVINGFISNSFFVASVKNVNEEEEVEDIYFKQLRTTPNIDTNPIEIESGKFLNVNPNLIAEKNQWLLQLLQKYSKEFTWDYVDMKGIHPNLCTHRIYLKDGCKPVRKPQCCMNLALRVGERLTTKTYEC